MARNGRAVEPARDPAHTDGGAVGDDRGNTVDPSSIDAAVDGGSTFGTGEQPGAPFGRFPDGRARKRRASGTRAGAGTKTTAPLDLKALEGILLNIHATIATMVHDPIWGITEGEAEQLARALASVSRHYPVPSLAPAVIDHVNLVMAICAVYGTRLAVVRMRGKETVSENVHPPGYPAGNGSLMGHGLPSSG